MGQQLSRLIRSTPPSHNSTEDLASNTNRKRVVLTLEELSLRLQAGEDFYGPNKTTGYQAPGSEITHPNIEDEHGRPQTSRRSVRRRVKNKTDVKATMPRYIKSRKITEMPDEDAAARYRYYARQSLEEKINELWKRPHPPHHISMRKDMACTCGPEHQVALAIASDVISNELSEDSRNAQTIKCIAESTMVVEERLIREVVKGRRVTRMGPVRIFVADPQETGLVALPPEVLQEIWVLSKNTALPFTCYGLAAKLLWTSTQVNFAKSIRETDTGRRGLDKILATVPMRGMAFDEAQKARMKALVEIPRPESPGELVKIPGFRDLLD